MGMENYGSDAWQRAVTDVNYSRYRTIVGTPTFLINGFKDSTVSEDTTYDQWVTHLNNLLGN
jgi:hypothetical protein